MKKIFLILKFVVLVVLYSISFAQESYNSYSNLYSGNKYDIQISYKDSLKYTLYIDMMSMDRLSKSGGIMVDKKEHEKFIKTLEEAKLKYEEWVKIAIDNNVTDLDKSMSLQTRVGGYFSYGSKWNFQYIVNLSFDFKIINDKKLLIVRTGKMTSSSNQFMTHDGFVFVFSNTEEITEFLDIISRNQINEFVLKPKSSELFKD